MIALMFKNNHGEITRNLQSRKTCVEPFCFASFAIEHLPTLIYLNYVHLDDCMIIVQLSV